MFTVNNAQLAINVQLPETNCPPWNMFDIIYSVNKCYIQALSNDFVQETDIIYCVYLNELNFELIQHADNIFEER